MAQLEIRHVFAKMPNEVFEQFIAPKIEFEIESLSTLKALITAPNWSLYFRNRPLDYWVNVEWKRLSIPFKDALVNEEARALSRKIANAFGELGTGKPEDAPNVPNSKERFQSCATCAESGGKFREPVVCLDEDGGWILLDGFHRLAAILALEENENFPFECWLGIHQQSGQAAC